MAKIHTGISFTHSTSVNGITTDGEILITGSGIEVRNFHFEGISFVEAKDKALEFGIRRLLSQHADPKGFIKSLLTIGNSND